MYRNFLIFCSKISREKVIKNVNGKENEYLDTNGLLQPCKNKRIKSVMIFDKIGQPRT